MLLENKRAQIWHTVAPPAVIFVNWVLFQFGCTLLACLHMGYQNDQHLILKQKKILSRLRATSSGHKLKTLSLVTASAIWRKNLLLPRQFRWKVVQRRNFGKCSNLVFLFHSKACAVLPAQANITLYHESVFLGSLATAVHHLLSRQVLVFTTTCNINRKTHVTC